MNLGLQAPVHGIRRKQVQDATKIHKRLHPASHLQRGPTRQRKSTYKAPAPTYTRQGSTCQSPQPKAVARGGEVGPAESQVRPNLDWHQSRCTLADDLFLSSQRRLSKFPYLKMTGTNRSSYKRGLHLPSQAFNFSFSYTFKEEK